MLLLSALYLILVAKLKNVKLDACLCLSKTKSAYHHLQRSLVKTLYLFKIQKNTTVGFITFGQSHAALPCSSLAECWCSPLYKYESTFGPLIYLLARKWISIFLKKVKVNKCIENCPLTIVELPCTVVRLYPFHCDFCLESLFMYLCVFAKSTDNWTVWLVPSTRHRWDTYLVLRGLLPVGG